MAYFLKNFAFSKIKIDYTLDMAIHVSSDSVLKLLINNGANSPAASIVTFRQLLEYSDYEIANLLFPFLRIEDISKEDVQLLIVHKRWKMLGVLLQRGLPVSTVDVQPDWALRFLNKIEPRTFLSPANGISFSPALYLSRMKLAECICSSARMCLPPKPFVIEGVIQMRKFWPAQFVAFWLYNVLSLRQVADAPKFHVY